MSLEQDNLNVAEEVNIDQPVEDISKIIEWVNQLKDTNTRTNALIQLSKKREAYSDLAIYLWYSPGIISVL
jgi:CCR4-NOT transcription complex subunit 9